MEMKCSDKGKRSRFRYSLFPAAEFLILAKMSIDVHEAMSVSCHP